jgi:hypothetical protein
MRTAEDEAEIAEHVNYEMKMLCVTAYQLLRPYRLSNVLSNAVVESFLVHARLLDDFFGSDSRGPKGRDVLATDFHPTWQRRRILTTAERDGISGKVVHLSNDRVHGFPWSVGDIVVRFADTFSDFVGDDSSRRKQFAQAVGESSRVAGVFRLAVEVARQTG